MTGADFREWLERAQRFGVLRTHGDAARALGVSPQTISAMLRDGVTGPAERRTALAMTAILRGDKPWRANGPD